MQVSLKLTSPMSINEKQFSLQGHVYDAGDLITFHIHHLGENLNMIRMRERGNISCMCLSKLKNTIESLWI